MANPRVSQDEIRAKRLAKEAEKAENASIEAQESVNPGGSVLGQSSASASPEPTPAPSLSPVASNPIGLPDLDAMLLSATPEQLQRIKVLAAAKGLTSKDVAASRKMPDGSMTVAVYLEPPIVEQLELWAEADGCSLVEEAQKRISEALTNYLYGDWNPVIEQTPVASTETAQAATK